MVTNRNQFSVTLLIVLLQIVFLHNHCSGDLAYELSNAFVFSKTTTTVEDLDHGKYNETQVTTGWTSNKEVSYFVLSPELIWTIKPISTYLKGSVGYGWQLGGKSISYPLRWDIEGYLKEFNIESGYLWDVNKAFTFIPLAGLNYTFTSAKIKHQKLFHSSINSFISQDGNRTQTSLYSPYIGFEIDFKSKFYNKYDVQFSFNYNVGYGWGHGRTKVHHHVITELPSTTRNGSHVKYRDILTHDLEFAVAYSPYKNWTVALEFDYNITYNTHNLPLKLNHHRELVEANQFTRSQHHVVSDFVSHQYGVYLNVVYGSEGEGAYISH